MNSEILTEVLPPKGGSHQGGSHQATVQPDQGFHASHFFVLLSLLAATAGVIVARPAGPENLILISLTIGAAGFAGYGFYRMLAPLVAPRREADRDAPISARLRADLEREKALTLRSIKELEFDRAMGKLSTRDFEEMSGRLRARATGIMRQLDEGSTAYRAVIEKELAARLGKGVVAAAPEPAAANTCTCGTGNDPDARFCKSCGLKLTKGTK
jgi:hypothetical protein